MSIQPNARMTAGLGLALALALLACAPKDLPEHAPGAGEPAPETAAGEPEGRPVASAPTKPEPPAPAPYVPNPKGFGDPCDDANPCAWDDPCAPTRCVGAEYAPTDVKCSERLPPPGECACVAERCSLRPSAPAPTSISCKLGPCGLDQGAGVCVEGAKVEANRTVRDVGPACHCEQGTTTCAFVWVEAIACEDVRDCWVSDAPPYHPVARPAKLRRKTFEPCRDGEVAPICRDGRCTVAAYSC